MVVVLELLVLAGGENDFVFLGIVGQLHFFGGIGGVVEEVESLLLDCELSWGLRAL